MMIITGVLGVWLQQPAFVTIYMSLDIIVNVKPRDHGKAGEVLLVHWQGPEYRCKAGWMLWQRQTAATKRPILR